jgi:GGDEF domain-containing protein
MNGTLLDREKGSDCPGHGSGFDACNRNRFVPWIDLPDRLCGHISKSLEHAIGDQALIGLARRLENSVRASDVVARLSGAEFVVLPRKVHW